MYIVYDSTVFGNIFSMLNHFRLPPLIVIISIARLKLIPFQGFENFVSISAVILQTAFTTP